MKFLYYVLATVSLAFTPSFAETEDEKKLRIANEYAVQAAEDMDIGRMIVQMWKPIIDQAEAQGKTISEEQRQEVDAAYQAAFAEPLLQIMKEQGPIIAKHLTLEEVEALATFYATPAGRSVMNKFPDMFADQQPMIMELVQENITKVMPVISKVVQ